MGKILVLYDSHGGSTFKMAELVAQGAAEIQSGWQDRLRILLLGRVGRRE